MQIHIRNESVPIKGFIGEGEGEGRGFFTGELCTYIREVPGFQIFHASIQLCCRSV